MIVRNNLMFKRKADSTADLVFLVLVAELVWEYRFLVIKAIFILGSIGLIGGLFLLIRIIRSLKNKYTKIRLITSLSDIDNIGFQRQT